MVRKVVVILSAAVMMLIALPASADNGSITDKKGDATGCWPDNAKQDCDIIQATWGHAPHHRLKHSVTVAGTIGDPSNGSGAMPTWYIDVPGHVGSNPNCDYFITEVPPGVGPNTSDSWKYYVEKCSNSQPTIVGAARSARPTEHRIVIKFRKKLIGSPSRYGWQVAIPADGDSTPYDLAPDSGFKKHTL